MTADRKTELKVRKALVIDDDEVTCRALAAQLRSLGVPLVATASLDRETLHLLNRGGPFDLIVTDLAMPGLDGLQVTRMIAVRQPNAAVIFVSAAGPKLISAARTLAAGRGLRVLAALAKPIRTDQLKAALSGEPEAAAAAAPTPAAPAATTARLLPLIRLLDRLLPIAALGKEVAALRERAAGDGSESGLAEDADQVGALLQRHCQQLEDERIGMVRLLDQVTLGMDSMSAFLSDEEQVRRAAQAESQTLTNRLLGEVGDLDSDVRGASDLTLLQQDVAKRLDRINASLHEVKAREEAQQREFEQRATQMKSRIDTLEAETRSLKESVQREQAVAATDGLTGLPNRWAYDQRIRDDHAQWKRYGQGLIIAVWDIDRFKALNDGYGHPAGDKALQAVAQRLRRDVRESDFVGRYGGEEFVMILRGVDLTQALAVVDKARRSVERIGLHFSGKPVALTASCGIAAFSGDDTPERVFARADAAMYRAKGGGRNRCVADAEGLAGEVQPEADVERTTPVPRVAAGVEASHVG